MPRKVPPPDFRYVWLMPGTRSTAIAMAVGTMVLGAAGVVMWSSEHDPMFAGLTLFGGALAVLGIIPGTRTWSCGRLGAREVAMAIVPWGIIVNPDTEPHVLRWPAIREVTVDALHTMNGGTPAVVSSIVTVRTERELLAGRTWGAAGLEDLTANLEAYAEEASRPVARDLDGLEEVGDGATEPVIADLLRCAEALCTTGHGAARLGLPPGGYRTVASRAATPETIALLRYTLTAYSDAEGSAPTPPSRTEIPFVEPSSVPIVLADPRPLAAIVAALLGAHELVPDLLGLVSLPHPVVAAVAKAAAVRLGAPLNRAGAIEEVSGFLFDDDYRRIECWAEG